MIKRMMLLLTALAALTAFAVPSAQGAMLTDQWGVKVELHTPVTMSSSNLRMTTSIGTIQCGNVTIHGSVLENSPEVVLAFTTTTTSECKLSGLLPMTITKPRNDFIEFAEGEGRAYGTFKYDIPAAELKDCHLDGFPEFTYESGSSIISLPWTVYVAGPNPPPGCPIEGETHGDFKLSDGFGPLTID